MSADAQPPTEALDLLLLVATLLEEDMARELPARGLTKARTHALWVLAQHDGCTQRQFADALGIAPRSATETIDALVRGGLVRRDPHPNDRRALRITLTDGGRRTATWLQESHAELATELFGAMSASRLRALVAALREVAERLSAAMAAAGEPDTSGRRDD